MTVAVVGKYQCFWWDFFRICRKEILTWSIVAKIFSFFVQYKNFFVFKINEIEKLFSTKQIAHEFWNIVEKCWKIALSDKMDGRKVSLV